MAKKQTKKEINEVEVINVGQVEVIGMEKNSETIEDRVQYEIGKFNFVDSKIQELKKQFKDLKIKGVDDKNGITAVSDALKIVRDIRTGIETKRTDLKSFYLKTGSGIDAEAKRIQALIAEVENPLKAKKEEIDQAIKKFEEEQEALQQKLIDDKVEQLKEAGIVFDGAFYSIGESISVDLGTIKDLDEEALQKLLGMVKTEKIRLDEIERLKQLHNSRKEEILPFWSFLTSEMHSVDFGEMTEERFNVMVADTRQLKEDFDAKQLKIDNEAKQQIQDRKDLNFEKRSFQFEKNGFEIDECGDASFFNTSGKILVKKDQLEKMSNEEFQKLFDSKIEAKTKLENEFKVAEDAKAKKVIKDAEDKVQADKDKKFNELLSSRETTLKSLGFTRMTDGFLVNESIKFDMTVIGEMDEVGFGQIVVDATKRKADLEVEKADQEEKAKLAKLPDLEKIERYCQVILDISVPEIRSEEAQKELQLLRSSIARSIEKTLSNIKTI